MNNIQKGVSESNLMKLSQYFDSRSWLVLLTTFVYLDTFFIISNIFLNVRQALSWEVFFSLENLTGFIVSTTVVYIILQFLNVFSNLIYLNRYTQSFIKKDDPVDLNGPFYKASDILRTAIVNKNSVLLDLYKAWATENKARLSFRKIAYFLYIFSMANVCFHGKLFSVLSRLTHSATWPIRGSFEFLLCFIISTTYLLYRLFERERIQSNYILLEYGLKDELVKYDAISK